MSRQTAFATERSTITILLFASVLLTLVLTALPFLAGAA